MARQPEPYDIFEYNNGNDQDFYFIEVPYRIAKERGIYTPKNTLSIWDHYELSDQIGENINRSMRLIRQGRIELGNTFDLDHLKNINRALIGDVIPTAGELRVVDLRVDNSLDQEASHIEVGKLSHSNIFNKFTQSINSIDLESVSKDRMAIILSTIHSFLIYTKPFRFQNQITSNIFINNITRKSPYNIDSSLLSPKSLKSIERISAIESHYKTKRDSKLSLEINSLLDIYWNALTPDPTYEKKLSNSQNRSHDRAHEQMAKRLPPPNSNSPKQPRLGR